MTEVYVDVAAAAIEAGSADRRLPTADPEAIRALRMLTDAGIRVVIVQASGLQAGDELRSIATEVVDTPPTQPRGPAWYLASDVERCRGSSARLRTVLIGAAPSSGSVRRCDAVSRNVHAAALEILAAEAMASPPLGG